MDNLKIELSDGYENVKAFYYHNGNGSILTCKDTKKPILNTAFYFTLLFFMLIFLNPLSSVGMIILTTITSIISIANLIATLIRCRRYINWKKSVEIILNKLKKYKTEELLLTDQTIEISNTDETTIDKWDTIQHATIKPDSIFMKGSTNTSYVFPAKSMEPNQFEKLSIFIKEKMRIHNLSNA
jgi:hypothetical protein